MLQFCSMTTFLMIECYCACAHMHLLSIYTYIFDVRPIGFSRLNIFIMMVLILTHGHPLCPLCQTERIRDKFTMSSSYICCSPLHEQPGRDDGLVPVLFLGEGWDMCCFCVRGGHVLNQTIHSEMYTMKFDFN